MSVDGMESSATSYADHEFQQVTANVQNDTGAEEEVEIVFPIDTIRDNYLDRNELAELKHLRHAVVISANTVDGAGINSGTVQVETGMEINTGSTFDSFLENLAGDGEQIATDDGSQGFDSYPIYQRDEPGHLTAMTFSAYIASGGGSGLEPKVQEKDFDAMYGGGPVLDKTDDIRLGCELEVGDLADSTVRVKHTVEMAWQVHEVERGRSAFALE